MVRNLGWRAFYVATASAASLVALVSLVDCGGEGSATPGNLDGVGGRQHRGGSDAGGDATADPPPTNGQDAMTAPVVDGDCDPAKPFGDPIPLFADLPAAFQTPVPRLSSDELTVYFSSDVDGGRDLFRASRATREAAFGTPEPLAVQSSPTGDFDPSVTLDHLTLYFHSQRSGAGDVYMATRVSTDVGFGMPSPVADVNDPAANDGNAYFRTAGGGELWFSSARGATTERIHRAAKKPGGFQAPVLVSELAGAWWDRLPMVTEDGRTMVFGSTRPGGKGGYDLWITQRPDDTSVWDGPVPIAELNSTGTEYPGSVSADRCRLYFSSSREGGLHRAYVAIRPR